MRNNKRFAKKITITILSLLTFCSFNTSSVFAQINPSQQEIIEHNKQVQAQNLQIEAQNKIIENVNVILKQVSNNYKFLNTEFKRIESNIKEQQKNNGIELKSGNSLLNNLANSYKKEISFYQNLQKDLKNIKTEQQLQNFKQSLNNKRLNNYRNVFKDVTNTFEKELKKQANKAWITLMSYAVVGGCFVIGVILTFFWFIFKSRKKNNYKKYFDNLKWTDIDSIHTIKYIDETLFLNALNSWIIKQLKIHFNEVLTIEEFKKNQQIMNYLKRSDFVSKSANAFYDEYVLAFLDFQIILIENNFVENIEKLIEDQQIKLTTNQMQNIITKAKLLETNLENQVLNYLSIPWTTKNLKTGEMTLNPESMFIFKPNHFIITNNSFEIEISYDKIYLKSSQQIAFKDKNNEYYINFNDENKLEIKNYIYRNIKKVLWVGVNYENI